jgi:hypothetical protein
VLYRDWMKIEFAAGNTTGVHKAITRCQHAARSHQTDHQKPSGADLLTVSGRSVTCGFLIHHGYAASVTPGQTEPSRLNGCCGRQARKSAATAAGQRWTQSVRNRRWAKPSKDLHPTEYAPIPAGASLSGSGRNKVAPGGCWRRVTNNNSPAEGAPILIYQVKLPLSSSVVTHVAALIRARRQRLPRTPTRRTRTA